MEKIASKAKTKLANLLKLAGAIVLLAVLTFLRSFLPEDEARQKSAETAAPDFAVRQYDAAKPTPSATRPVTKTKTPPIPAGAYHGFGKVSKILRDDDEGLRHQRFILRLEDGSTLLVVHNIDVAPRVADLDEGDTVEFCGEFVDNDRGGLVHWTHHDPARRHADGFLVHKGRVYK